MRSYASSNALALAASLLVTLAVCQHHAAAEDAIEPIKDQHQLQLLSPLDRLKQSVSAVAAANPGMFEPADLENFFANQGATSAQKFLDQRGQNSRRASHLAQRALKWRHELDLAHLDASRFPCDLFQLGLIFEYGRGHQRNAETGAFTETNPVIWVRLGALGSVIKQLERLSPARLVSYAYNSPKTAFHRMQAAFRNARQRHDLTHRPSILHLSEQRAARRAAKREAKQQAHATHVQNLSLNQNGPLKEVLKSIAWWLENWVRDQGEQAKAILVLDFENTDFAFASWSVGEFFVKLDDMFPDLFEQIIGFRYKAKLWSLHSPISMFNRIFKSRLSSSAETDAKLKFVSSEAQMSAYMPRVDSQGFTMLPPHVSGQCQAPDESKAPAGCRQAAEQADQQLNNPALWQAINNEFYQTCRAKPRD